MKANKWKSLIVLAVALPFALQYLFAYTFTSNRFSAAAASSGITMQLQLGSSSGTLIDGSASWGQVAENALAEWNSHLKNFRFTVVRNSTIPIQQKDNKNSVFWSSTVFGQSFGSSTLALTQSWTTSGVRTESDVVFNTAKGWNSYRGNYRSGIYDLYRVALHEFGHVLGLDHPDEAGQSVTAQMNSTVGNLDALAADDIAGGQVLWGSNMNLALYQPSGWTDKILVSRTSGTNSDSSSLLTTETLYVDFAPVNTGSAAINAAWSAKLYVDNSLVHADSNNAGLSGNTYYASQDHQVGPLSAGTHTLKVVVDADSWVIEDNEGDNTYQRTITVSAPPSGSVQVTLGPSGAVSAGALWQIDGGSLRSSGATVSGLSLGNHTVAFYTISGWSTPSSQSVTVYANQTTQVTGTYLPRYAVTPSAGANGTISPGSAQIVGAGGSVAFTATPGTNYVVNQWLVNGSLVETGGNAFTLSNINANSTVAVTFTVPIAAALTAPTASPVPSGPVTFAWDSGFRTDSYWLYVGVTPNGYEFYNSNAWTTNHSVTINLPPASVYVTLFSASDGKITSRTYNFLLAAPQPAVITSPSPGTQLASTNATFNWNTGFGFSTYMMTIGSSLGASDLFLGSSSTSLSQSVTGLPQNGQNLYVRLTSQGATTMYADFGYTAPFSINANLGALSLSSGTLNPGFAAGVTSYTAGVSNGVTTLTMTPTVADSTAKVKVNGTLTSSGSPSGVIALNLGANSIPVVVTAQDGTTTKTYTVVVTRAPGPPLLSSPTSSAVTGSTATLGGNVTGDNGATVTERGIVYSITSTNNNPSIGGPSVTQTATGGTTGAFTLGAVNLAPGTNYSFKAYAINSAGTTYTSPAATFSTLAVPPTITTQTVTGVTGTSATLGGNISSDGGGPITERGVVYSVAGLNGNPLIGGPNVTKSITSGTTGVFSLTVAGLSPGADYLFRAYAVNSAGTAYVGPGAFTTLSNNTSLSGLSPSSGSLVPGFATGVLNYTISVPNAVTSFSATPTVAGVGATVTVNNQATISGNASGPVNLLVGPNNVVVKVTAQDGVTTKNYTITITRAPSTNADLASLVPSAAALAPGFSSATLSYTAGASYAFVSITITPGVAQPDATVKVNGSTVTSGSASTSIPLNVGPNVITTVVTAQDGITTKTYTLTFTRAVAVPEIAVEQSQGVGLISGVSTIDFSKVDLQAVASSQVTIRNIGTANLTGLALNLTGVHSTDFAFGNLADTLAPGASQTIAVTTTPSALGNRSATLRVISNDAAHSPFDVLLTSTGTSGIAFANALTWVPEAAGTVQIPIVRIGGSAGPLTVNVSTVPGTATTADFEAMSNQLVSFAEGETSKNVALTIKTDKLSEPNESFTLVLTNPQGGAELRYPTTATVRIIDANDLTKPTVTISTPAASANIAEGAALSVTGTAADNKGVTKVQVSLNGGAFADAAVIVAANGLTASYSLAIAPVPGVNTLAVKSFDTSNLASALVSRSFNYNVLRQLTVNVTGAGSVTKPFPGVDGTKKIGFSYTLTATPAAGSMFAGWVASGTTGTGITSAATELAALTFTHQEGLVLTAQFITNPFAPSIIGKFNGLVTPHPLLPAPYGTAPSNESTGFLTAAVTSTGSFSGTLKIDGLALPFSGLFNTAGAARFGVARTATVLLPRVGKTGLTLELSLDLTGVTNKLLGTVTQKAGAEDVTVSVVDADRACYSATNKVSASLAGLVYKPYTMVMACQSPQDSSLPTSSYPQGKGYATGNLKTDGTVTFSGKLPDNTAVSFSVPLSKSNTWPLFAQLYALNKGFVAGVVTVDDLPADTDMLGTHMQWMRPPAMSQWYPAGWSTGIQLEATGSQFAGTPSSAFPGLANPDPLNGNASISFLNANQQVVVGKNVNISTTNVVSKAPATDASFTFSLTATSGLIGGIFTYPDNTKPAFQGVLFQKGAGKGGHGFYMTTAPKIIDGTGQSGGVTLNAK